MIRVKHDEAVKRAWLALADLRRKGERRITLKAIAARAKIVRATLYKENPDWNKLRQAIRTNEHCSELRQAMEALPVSPYGDLEKLSFRLDVLEKRIVEALAVVDSTFNAFVSDLQRLAVLNHEAQQLIVGLNEPLADAHETNQQLIRAQAELSALKLSRARQNSK